MKIIGCDFHPGYQQIAVLDWATGEIVEKALSHERKEEVRAFYAGIPVAENPVSRDPYKRVAAGRLKDEEQCGSVRRPSGV